MYHDNELVPPHSLNGQHHGATVTAAVKPSADPGKKRDPCQWTNKKLSFVAESTDSIEGINEKRNVKKSLTLTALKKAAFLPSFFIIIKPFKTCISFLMGQGVSGPTEAKSRARLRARETLDCEGRSARVVREGNADLKGLTVRFGSVSFRWSFTSGSGLS